MFTGFVGITKGGWTRTARQSKGSGATFGVVTEFKQEMP
jgi:hypothetical protein